MSTNKYVRIFGSCCWTPPLLPRASTWCHSPLKEFSRKGQLGRPSLLMLTYIYVCKLKHHQIWWCSLPSYLVSIMCLGCLQEKRSGMTHRLNSMGKHIVNITFQQGPLQGLPPLSGQSLSCTCNEYLLLIARDSAKVNWLSNGTPMVATMRWRIYMPCHTLHQ